MDSGGDNVPENRWGDNGTGILGGLRRLSSPDRFTESHAALGHVRRASATL